jgi:hypothetical protein
MVLAAIEARKGQRRKVAPSEVVRLCPLLNKVCLQSTCQMWDERRKDCGLKQF